MWRSGEQPGDEIPREVSSNTSDLALPTEPSWANSFEEDVSREGEAMVKWYLDWSVFARRKESKRLRKLWKKLRLRRHRHGERMGSPSVLS